MDFFIDMTLLGLSVIGLTAFMGIITHGVASKIFGRASKKFFLNKSKGSQTGWNKVEKRT
ncbi:hypothetical protein [Pseudalkalibacillus berkeleyi]|uniref:Uncharacterized protein n=1 Tax=Pseudalkalibacillus berkeleyi TaxID=1069813 RepID=A0ABS9GZ25_9BACL|nr:hypothetical protein [Pseudalkalibacillus berkeleyi]MCF6136848.1 hypothetical protein [Pseudalkalibacillus berkeleyi]